MSSKNSAQPGRRTPLSLSGAVTKTHPNKGGGANAATGGSNNANGHSTSNKQDNKLQQLKTEQQHTVNNTETKENPNKKQTQSEKKVNESSKKSNEKNQNGVNTNKQQQFNENKQQQSKDKQHQNGNDNKVNEKDKKEKIDKSDKSDKIEKQVEISEKVETKTQEDKKLEQDKFDIKKEENKNKEVKEIKVENKDVTKGDDKVEQSTEVKNDDKKSNEHSQIKNVEETSKEIIENIDNMDVVEEQQQLQPKQQKSPPVTPKTNSKANKTSTPVNKTPTKASEKTPQKSTPQTSNTGVKTTPVTKRTVTTTIDDDNDIEMEPLVIDSSPIKLSETAEVTQINTTPSATSTPGKILLSKRYSTLPKSEVQLAMQTGISPERPRAFSQISGRKSIRPISDYIPSKFESNSQFRESYRRINTELDVTNTSMNVTVGSEVPNNLSFSFFGRGRKRERTPPQHSQSAIGELQIDIENSPPKRARLDMYGFLSAVASPISLLRNRFSKATLECSTPVKLQDKLNLGEDEIEVQNVSGLSVHEEISQTEINETSNTGSNDNNVDLGEEGKETKLSADVPTVNIVENDSEDKEFTNVSLKSEKSYDVEQTSEQSDITVTETPLQTAIVDKMGKNKRCVVM